MIEVFNGNSRYIFLTWQVLCIHVRWHFDSLLMVDRFWLGLFLNESIKRLIQKLKKGNMTNGLNGYVLVGVDIVSNARYYLFRIYYVLLPKFNWKLTVYWVLFPSFFFYFCFIFSVNNVAWRVMAAVNWNVNGLARSSFITLWSDFYLLQSSLAFECLSFR